MNKKILYIGNKLSKHGNTATSIETLGSFFEKEGCKVFYASSFKNKFLRLLDMIFKTLKFAKKVDYVLIDVYSTQNFYFALITSQLCRLLNVKYIAKLHGGNLPSRLQKNPFLCDLIFKNSYKISAPSNYLFDTFNNRYSNKLTFIPNTIQINNYNFFEREINVPKLLWVRSFSKIYNPKMAIKVLSLLKEKYPEAQLCMVGPDKENLIDACKEYANKLNVKVEFTGKLSKKKWIELSKEYNIFINTTHFDNTPISVIEAMALGLPVISTNVGGIPFLLENKISALLIQDNNHDEMVFAVNELINNSILKETIVKNARKKVEQYDWKIVKHKWIEILK